MGKDKSVIGTVISLPGKIWALIKFIIFIVVIASIVIGYSGYKTIRGFSDDGVTQSDQMYIHYREDGDATANFTLTLKNDGYLPIKAEILFTMYPGVELDIGGGGKLVYHYETTETFNVPGGEEKTKNITFGAGAEGIPADVAAQIEDGSTVTYVPTWKGTYSYIVPFKETELKEEKLVVLKQNYRPRVTNISVTPNPVLTGETVKVSVDATDPENETLYYNYTMNGNKLAIPMSSSGFNWTAPEVPGKNILGIEISDERNTVKRVIDISVQKPLYLTLNSTADHDTGKMNIWVNSSKDLGAVIPDFSYFHEDTTTDLDLTGSGTQFTGSFDFSVGKYLLNASVADSQNPGYTARETGEMVIELVDTVDKKATVRTSNITLDITTSEDVVANLTIAELTENPVIEESLPDGNLFSMKKFIRIETEDVLKDALETAQIRVDYDDADLPPRTNESDIALYYWNEATGEWEKQQVDFIDTEENYFLVTLTHFSIYGGFSTNRAPFVNAGDDRELELEKAATFTVYYEDDLGDTATKYEWDFDGDGVYDIVSNSSASATHTYETEGTYAVTVRVTDSGGSQGFDTISVTVTEKETGLAGALSEMPAFQLPFTVMALLGVLTLIAFRRRREEN